LHNLVIYPEAYQDARSAKYKTLSDTYKDKYIFPFKQQSVTALHNNMASPAAGPAVQSEGQHTAICSGM
jgi:hypothetical protein